ncbi:FixH family protein [Pseudomonas sp. KNUC1026]|uniref:FixH family protein n=1 Tax=Pseudomonas sp. KNUC1026 TaxID=2893890 RepID=UPI001F4301ED|nr:FixH family protein [Pseudomonas sp. KNUC1026]UFH50555.1 FixH family protein [Pseudomonas sp. KNUC1026]
MNPHAPWYRQRWPWIILAMMAGSLGGTLLMVALSVLGGDGLVNDHYYEAGLGINRNLDREHLAQALKLGAEVRIDGRDVQVTLTGQSLPPALQLNLLSPTLPDQDLQVQLAPTGLPGRYQGQLPRSASGRRLVELLGEHGPRTWRLFEEHDLLQGQPIELGQRPLAGELRAP